MYECVCIPEEDVEVDGGTRVTEMAEVVGGDSTNVHRNLTRNTRFENLFLLRQ